MLLSRINDCGDTLWVKAYGQTDEAFIDSRLCSIDANYFLNASSYRNYSLNTSAYSLSKCSIESDTLWTKKYAYADSYIHAPKGIIKTPDGGFAIIGGYQDPASYEAQVWLIKTDSMGVLQWQQSYGNPNEVESAEHILPTSDGGYLITAYRYVNNQVRKVWLIKTDSLGGVVWEKTHGNNYSTRANSVVLLNDGYLLSGIQYPDNPNLVKGRAYLLKVNFLGEYQWSKTYGNGSANSAFYKLLLLPDSSLIAGGAGGNFEQTISDVEGWLYKLNLQGDSLWARTYIYDTAAIHDYFWDIVPADAGGFMCVGFADVTGTPDGQDAWVVRTDSLGNPYNVVGCGGVGIAPALPPLPASGFVLAPNPAAAQTTLYLAQATQAARLDVYDMSGKLPKSLTLPDDAAEYHFSVADLPVGMYVCRVGDVGAQKLVVLK